MQGGINQPWVRRQRSRRPPTNVGGRSLSPHAHARRVRPGVVVPADRDRPGQRRRRPRPRRHRPCSHRERRARRRPRGPPLGPGAEGPSAAPGTGREGDQDGSPPCPARRLSRCRSSCLRSEADRAGQREARDDPGDRHDPVHCRQGRQVARTSGRPSRTAPSSRPSWTPLSSTPRLIRENPQPGLGKLVRTRREPTASKQQLRRCRWSTSWPTSDPLGRPTTPPRPRRPRAARTRLNAHPSVETNHDGVVDPAGHDGASFVQSGIGGAPAADLTASSHVVAPEHDQTSTLSSADRLPAGPAYPPASSPD